MKVLVVGATGMMGRETTRQLLAAGWQVRAMTRAPHKAPDLQLSGAELVRGDLIDPHSLAQACQGVYAVVDAAHSLLGSGMYSPNAVDNHGKRALIDAAKTAGVEHFIFTSMLGASPGSPVHFMRYKALIEKYVEGSGLKYTILRPPAFMEWHAHFFLGQDILKKGKASILGRGEMPTNFMAARDVARFAVIALKNDRAANRVLEIGGLDNITKNDVARLYMRLSEKQAEITHMPVPLLLVMAVLLRPFNPGISRIMHIAYVNERQNQSFDARKVLSEFSVDPLCIEDFIQARVTEWKAGRS